MAILTSAVPLARPGAAPRLLARLGARARFSTAGSAAPGRELLHTSRIPTHHFQDSLPKLPIPKLEASLLQLRYFAGAVLSKEELEELDRRIASFAVREGPRLQAELVARDQKVYSSFISKPWFNLYLSDRRPLLLNYNPQLTFKDEPSPSSQASRAARLAYSAMTFLRTLEAKVLEPDVFHTSPERSKQPWWPEVMRLLPRGVSFYGAAASGAFPLDMSQYANLFRSTRVPGAEKDFLRVSEGSRHVTVQRGGRFWAVELLDEDGATRPLEQIHGAMQAIIDAADSQPAPPDEAVGFLTSLPRDEWAALRTSLLPDNRATIDAIDSALFSISLDTEAPKTVTEVCRCFLHGSGVDRWLDKSFQLIVSANAKAAVNFEHSWGDGVAVLRFFNEVYNDSLSLPSLSTAKSPVSPPSRLDWRLTPDLKAAVTDAASRFASTIASTDLAACETDVFTSGVLKGLKLSPDGMMQMAFQLAHMRMHGSLVSTYESASTSAFKHGRTETIRSATPEALQFAATFCDPAASSSARLDAMKLAVSNHSRITRSALMGQGIDRHLFALQDLASSQGEVPPLFTCKPYSKLTRFIISTSTLASDALENGGFGPVNEDCYAVGYGIRDHGCRSLVMTYGRDSQGFAEHIEKAMVDMRSTAQKA